MIKNSNTLRHKLLLTTISTLLVLAVALGAASVYIVHIVTAGDSVKIVTELCESEALKIDNKLELVKNSVEIIHEYAKEHQRYISDIYSPEFESSMKEFTITVANRTDGAMAVYFRYNPEITGSGTDGFFWSRESDKDTFKEVPPTDILAYSFSDTEHVGWFYNPKESGKALWMNPYLNKNIGVFMISYVTPVYMENGEFVGVIGMDIDFKSIIDEACGNRIYKSGQVVIADLNDRLTYSADGEGIVQTDNLPNRLYNHITTVNKENELLEITDSSGASSVICCRRLNNGMVMYVNVPKSEINYSRNSLVKICLILTAVIWTISVYITQKKIRSIVNPLKKLTEVASGYSEGNWEDIYIADTQDEIQVLSEKLAIMAENTQKYINDIENLARMDALTGLGNKTAYLEEIYNIKVNRHDKFNEYAVSVMDLNLLKLTNDTKGHDVGDMLLKEASAYICSTFEHSAIFRIGGDEFAVILYSDDYRNRETLLKKFEDGMGYTVPGTDGVIVSIAYGLAACPEDGNKYDELFELADDRMYQKKKEMKLGR